MKTLLINFFRLKKRFRVLLGVATALLIIAIIATVAYLANPQARMIVDTKIRPFLFGGSDLSYKCKICVINCSNFSDYYVCLSECELLCN